MYLNRCGQCTAHVLMYVVSSIRMCRLMYCDGELKLEPEDEMMISYTLLCDNVEHVIQL